MHREEAEVSLAWWHMAGNPSTFEVKAGGCQPGLCEVLSQNVWEWAGLGMYLSCIMLVSHSGSSGFEPQHHIKTDVEGHTHSPSTQELEAEGSKVNAILLCIGSLRSAWTRDPV